MKNSAKVFRQGIQRVTEFRVSMPYLVRYCTPFWPFRLLIINCLFSSGDVGSPAQATGHLQLKVRLPSFTQRNLAVLLIRPMALWPTGA